MQTYPISKYRKANEKRKLYTELEVQGGQRQRSKIKSRFESRFEVNTITMIEYNYKLLKPA